jgi:5-methylcytosine-specific restriction endonuclease McrA
VGACYTCGTELRFRDMECGHVVAHALGGSTELANLMAVCRTCNRDMGIRNLEAYRRRICEMRGDLDAESESEWDVQDTEMT